MAFGVDYSSARPTIATLQKYQVEFVCRYIAAIDTSFNLSLTEVRAFLKAGIKIVPIFETHPSRALGGFNAGVNDAKDAEAYLEKVRLPKDSPVYFTVDFNPTSSEMQHVKEYFRGIGSIHGVTNVGVYGGYQTVRTIHAYGLAAYFWQTYAWSDGQWLASANIRQERNGVSWPGAQVDYNSSYTRDFGQYPRPTAPIITSEMVDSEEMQVLDLKAEGPAVVLGVPAGAKNVRFHADPGFRASIAPKIRVGLHPPWAEKGVSPKWGAPVTIPCEGVQEITIARLDSGDCPVTVAFTS